MAHDASGYSTDSFRVSCYNVCLLATNCQHVLGHLNFMCSFSFHDRKVHHQPLSAHFKKHGMKQGSGVANELWKKIEAWKVANEEKIERKRIVTAMPQRKAATTPIVPYNRDEPQYKDITRSLAIFVGAENVPNSLVWNEGFRSLLHVLDPKYQVPTVATLFKEVDMLVLHMKAKIQLHLANVDSVSLCADVWSKKGLSSSYVGVTVHFFAKDTDKSIRTATLAVKRIEGSITSFAIRQAVDEVLQSWNIEEKKVKAVVTDNASNMVRAFKDYLIEMTEADKEWEEVAEEGGVQQQQVLLGQEGVHQEPEVSGGYQQETGRGEGTWEMDDGDLQMALEEGASIGGDIEVYDVGGHQDGDVSLEEKEITDFRLREEEHEIAFNGLLKLSCFAHTVQLVILKFNKDKRVASVLKRVRSGKHIQKCD